MCVKSLFIAIWLSYHRKEQVTIHFIHAICDFNIHHILPNIFNSYAINSSASTQKLLGMAKKLSALLSLSGLFPVLINYLKRECRLVWLVSLLIFFQFILGVFLRVVFPKFLFMFLTTAETELSWQTWSTVRGDSKSCFTTDSTSFRNHCNHCTSRTTFLSVLLLL